MEKKERVFVVSMINIFFSYEPTGNAVICLQLLGTSKLNLSLMDFPKLRQRQKVFTWIYTQIMRKKKSDDRVLVKLKHLTRKIKLKNVIRRFGVSNIITKNENRYGTLSQLF